MPTYVYETIPGTRGAKPRQFEIRHSINSPALTHDPETGEPVRRVISGGAGVLTSGSAAPAPHRHSGGCCGGGCGR